MDKEIEELKKVIEEANNGNWLPLAMIVVLFGIIISIILWIYKKNIDDDKSWKDKSMQILDKVTDSVDELKLITAGIQKEIQHNKEQIRDNKESVKQINNNLMRPEA